MLLVKDIYQMLTCEYKAVKESATKQEIIEALLEGSPLVRSVCVVDEGGKLMGIITLADIMKGIAVQSGYNSGVIDLKSSRKLFQYSPFSKAGDIMSPPVYVSLDMKFQTALEKMIEHELDELPVIDEQGRLIGDLNAFELLQFA